MTTPGGEATLTSAAAVDVGAGAAYTAFTADFDIDPAQVPSGAVTPPDDGTLATISLTTFNPEGTVTVTGLDGALCADVDYADDEKAVTGTIAADLP
ncbi:hypothetical protein [Euzebya sp.]|uniref:hypothetical protein n=1 Tax=Euzebya sp. TaxID=1971409 RepID=UPI0035144E68